MDKASIYKKSTIKYSYKDFLSITSKDIPNEVKSLLFEETPIESKQFKLTEHITSDIYTIYEKHMNSNHIFNQNQKRYYQYNQNNKSNYNKPFNRSNSSNNTNNYFYRNNSEAPFCECKINEILNINSSLCFDNDKPFWYCFDDNDLVAYGLYSSNQVIEMYTQKLIDGNTFIRPIDYFKCKKKEKKVNEGEENNEENKNENIDAKTSNYIRLKEVENGNVFFDNFELNNEFDGIIRKYEEITKGKDIKEDKENKEIKEIKEEKEENNDKKEEKEKKVQIMDKNDISTKKNESNAKEIIDKDIIDNIDSIISTSEPKDKKVGPKTKKSKKKAKMTEIDVQTGFYTVSKEEKDFSEIFTAGKK